MQNTEIREHAWRWYERMLTGGDEGILRQVNPYNTMDWPLRVIGAVLVGFDDPVARWVQAWESLFEQRFHARFLFEPKLLEPSLHLVRTGMGAIDVFLSEDMNASPPESQDCTHKRLSEHMRQLWRVLLKGLQYLVSGQGGIELLAARQEMARLFAYMPTVFKSSMTAEFMTIAPLLKVDEILALRVAYSLFRNGVGREELGEMFSRQQMDLRRIGEEAMSAADTEPSLDPSGTLNAMLHEVLGDTDSQ